jgi:adenosylmethionine-8-amino-7-oxononanoate aminotransferase
LSRSTVWHPFTQHAIAPLPVPIVAADGAYLTAADGRRIYDGISSWWVVTHGHRHPRIIDAIKRQADQLDQVIFAGFTHAPAEEAAEKLVQLTARSFGNTELAHVFYSDSGSTAVEVGLKMALGFWRNIGVPRTRIIALEHAYHGDTIGTMSAGARGIFNAPYEPLLFDVARLPFPAFGREQETFTALEELLRQTPTAAIILEPLLLGAGGMLIYSPAVLRRLSEIGRAHGALLIADEVMTGFGRTGTIFACEQACITPDILCVAKGLTGGSVPLAATISTRAIFDAHYSTDRTKTFFHSSSYTANPIACAAASANLDIWLNEPVAERIAALADFQSNRLAALPNDGTFTDCRQIGTITAVDVAVNDAGYLADIGPKLYQHAIANGVLLRPLGNTLYVMPPYCTTADDLDRVYAVMQSAVQAVTSRM